METYWCMKKNDIRELIDHRKNRSHSHRASKLNVLNGEMGSAFRSGKLGNLRSPRSGTNKIITIFQ